MMCLAEVKRHECCRRHNNVKWDHAQQIQQLSCLFTELSLYQVFLKDMMILNLMLYDFPLPQLHFVLMLPCTIFFLQFASTKCYPNKGSVFSTCHTILKAPVYSFHLTPTSFTELKTGRSRCVDPPLPGDTPPTRLPPYSMACWLWKVPCTHNVTVSLQATRAAQR